VVVMMVMAMVMMTMMVVTMMVVVSATETDFETTFVSATAAATAAKIKAASRSTAGHQHGGAKEQDCNQADLGRLHRFLLMGKVFEKLSRNRGTTIAPRRHLIRP
jgi:hypothetical protein